MRISKKRLLIGASGVTALGAVATLVAGVTFGLFSSQQTSTGNAFTADSVTLTQSGTTTCTFAHVQPGDSGANSCSLPWTYSDSNTTNNAPAAIAVDVVVTSESGGTNIQTPYGGTPPTAANALWDGTSNGLQLTITNGATTLVNGYTFVPEGGGSPTAISYSSGVTNILVNSNATDGASGTVTVSYSMPNNSTSDAYTNASTTIELIVHAVQVAHNTLPADCAVGDQCLAGGDSSTFAWS